ncbi:response regulator [Paenibacillus sp. LHD-117]|uniref:response regulator n=1 Tax=Paenibacillus sp. LHD-117 TaxID=3071412 RepID=UPI0027E17DB6|nr:response regulator [Paenibacillus sp. LHD-117]MDQ6419382.1 response regulator [Paenibacillus sp. LHD-117]
MPRIVVVDDEAIFRRGLRAMIESLDPEWEVVGDARDGYEALELLQRMQPDVVLTDIRMPKMDGLQLQTIARERFPELLCVVISGYEDFSYVQQSMRSGAKDYIMKPVEREDLARVLGRLKEELRAKRSADPAEAPKDDRQLRQQASDHLVAGIMRGGVQQQDLDLLGQLGIELDDPYFNCLVIKLDKESVERERYRQSDPSLFQLYIQQFVQEMLDHRMPGFSFIFSETEVAALVNQPDMNMTPMLEMAESIRRQIKSLSNLTVTIGVGRPVKGFESMTIPFREAGIALLYRLVVGGDKVIDYRNAAQSNFFKSDMKKWSWEELEKAINEGRRDEVERLVEISIADLCAKAQTPELVHQQICKLLIHYYELSEDLGMTREWLGDKDIRTMLVEICSISSSNELIEVCRSLLGSLTSGIAAGNKPAERDPIQMAERHLEKHYHEPVTLKDIADKVFLNAAYFSTLFKQRTGKTFVERLTEIRVEEAKRRLASTDEKIVGIADTTGFTNIRHFNRVFKNETGVTPKEYREGVRSRR